MSRAFRCFIFIYFFTLSFGVEISLLKRPETRSDEYVVTWDSNHKESLNSLRASQGEHFEKEQSFFEIGDFSGFSGPLTETELENVQNMEHVEAIQHSLKYKMSQQSAGQSGSETNPGWGLDRIDQENLPLNNEYDWPEDGSGVDVYILDSGVETDIPIWNEGQANFGADCFRTVCSTTTGQGDSINHGTPIAAIVASQERGVAKGATIWGVKVFDITAPATSQFIINGFDFVVQHDNGGRPKVIVLGLAVYEKDDALNNAVIAAKNSGITIVMAAGNGSDTPEPDDACEQSPQMSLATIVVAGSQIDDQSAFFTNFGTCVDLYAPAFEVDSFDNTGAPTTVSGTSYGTAYVGGVAAQILGRNKLLSPDQVKQAIVQSANPVITNVPTQDTPNILIYTIGAIQESDTLIFESDEPEDDTVIDDFAAQEIPRSTTQILISIAVILILFISVAVGCIFLTKGFKRRGSEEVSDVESSYFEFENRDEMEEYGGIEYVDTSKRLNY